MYHGPSTITIISKRYLMEIDLNMIEFYSRRFSFIWGSLAGIDMKISSIMSGNGALFYQQYI